MGDVIDLSSRRKNINKVTTDRKTDVKLFDEISKMWGADFDKILFEDDPIESKKLDRAVNKANLEYTTKLMDDGVDLNEADEETT